MTLNECADALRSFIRHREKMHECEMVLVDEDGAEASRGKVKPETDILYQAVKIALNCVEEKI